MVPKFSSKFLESMLIVLRVTRGLQFDLSRFAAIREALAPQFPRVEHVTSDYTGLGMSFMFNRPMGMELVSERRDLRVHFQDYQVSLRWQSRRQGDSYPGFASMRESFSTCVNALPPETEVTSVALTYVNQLDREISASEILTPDLLPGQGLHGSLLDFNCRWSLKEEMEYRLEVLTAQGPTRFATTGAMPCELASALSKLDEVHSIMHDLLPQAIFFNMYE